MLDRARETRECEVDVGRIEVSSRDFSAQLGEHCARRVGNRSVAFASDERRDCSIAQQIVDGGQFAVEIGPGSGLHKG